MKFFYLFSLVIASMVLTSCGDLYADEELDTVTSLSESDTNTSVTKLDTWQKQVEYGYSRNGVTKSSSGQELPRLIGHTHLGTVTSETHKAAIIEDLFADEDVVVIGEASNFDIRYVKDIKQAGISYPFDVIKSRIADRLAVGMDLIKFKWSYKGQTYYTTAIASNNEGGIIYDPIGSAIPAEKAHGVAHGDAISKTGKLLKTQSETETTGPVTKTFPLGDSDTGLLFGHLLWSYDILITSSFDKNGKLTSYSATGVGRAHDPLWSCLADARTVSGSYGSLSHSYAWAYAYGMTGVSLKFSGSSYSVSGGSGQGAGTGMHSANS